MKRPFLVLLVTLLVMPATVRANGRFPSSTQLVVHPVDPQTLLLRATFGLLLSHDGGKTFDWVCERAVGYGGTQDPAIGLTGSGSLLVAAFEGLARSVDQGCSFSFAEVSKNDFIIDVAVDRLNPSSAVAVSSTGMSNLTFHVQVLETLDNGKSWQFIGAPIDPEMLAETIDPAPSRPQRLYVSGFSSMIEGNIRVRHGALYVSDDRGQSWQRHEVDLAGDSSVYIAAVDPQNPDRVYLRTSGPERDRLLRTDDAGKSFSELTSVPGAMLGFALSPDGTRVAVGGPSAGILVADTTTLSFAQTGSAQVACLTWTSQGLYACGNPFKDGFTMGLSSDEGQTFEPLLTSFGSLRAPLACGAEPDPATTCASDWIRLKSDFGIEDGPAGAAGMPSDGVSGQGAGGVAAGGSGAGISRSDSSCGCQSIGLSATGAGAVSALGLLVILAARRSRHGH